MKKLTPCPDSPNCVSSQTPAASDHHVEPLWCSGTEDECLNAVEHEVRALRTRDVVRTGNRLSCVFVTPILRFRDDVDFLAKPGVVHVRSASRLGWWDMGANRMRVERLRARLAESRPDIFGPDARPASAAPRPETIRKKAREQVREQVREDTRGPGWENAPKEAAHRGGERSGPASDRTGGQTSGEKTGEKTGEER